MNDKKLVLINHCLNDEYKDFAKEAAVKKGYEVGEAHGAGGYGLFFSGHNSSKYDRVVAVICDSQESFLRERLDVVNFDSNNLEVISLEKKEGCGNSSFDKDSFERSLK